MSKDPEGNGEGLVDEFDESEGFEPEDLVTITDENGKSIECAILAVIEHEGDDYALVAPLAQLTSEEGDEVEMFIFLYAVDDEGNQTFGQIDEDAVYEAVRDEFAKLLGQE